ncbi:MAG: hypothetical protein LBD78_09295 [Spirochaetaceae bacterium]|nr:hypothetical protein [Spirochaetaceae bacterium]
MKQFKVSAVLKGLALPVLGLVFLLCSCAEPVPLYGKWADNQGDVISFFNDGTFAAVITNPRSREKVNYQGDYTVLLNVLTFTCSDIELQVVSEWDIRGNMLYLNWPSSTDLVPLTLYKIAN